MNKLSKKFIIGIVVILGTASLCSILFYTHFLERYYLHQKSREITSINEKFEQKISSGISTKDAVSQIEAKNKVLIVNIENNEDVSSDMANDEIRKAFQEKGIGFQKYWLWEGDYQQILAGETRIRLYKQENLNYSLLVEYMQHETQLYAVTMIIPDISDAFGIIKSFLFVVNIATILIAVTFIIILIQQITKPLSKFKEFAIHMKSNEFTPIEVHTKDELEHVADNLNEMGAQIVLYQQSLQEKNRQMESLLDDVAHELKTPVSLIQLYATGMKDGLDDGTFVETILMESRQMEEMIHKLLDISRISKQTPELQPVDVSILLYSLIEECQVLAAENKMIIISNIENRVIIDSCEELLKTLFMNLITNAVKYASGLQIEIELKQNQQEINFVIINETDNQELDLKKIWSPYYVGEQSRNKKLSGTGLGLTIVDKICEELQYSIGCTMDGGRIIFTLVIPN